MSMSSTATPFFLDRNRHFCGFVPGIVATPPVIVDPLKENVKKSYAAAVKSADLEFPPLQVDVEQLSIPSLKGNEIVITLSEEIYQKSIQECRSNLLGRIFYPKNLSSISIGKGYFDMHFATVDEMHRFQSRSSWNLKCRVFRVMPWQPDFNPKAPKTTHAQVWVKIAHISQEYWLPRLIMEIAKGVGTPLQFDKATVLRHYGHFARLLIEVDLAKPLPHFGWRVEGIDSMLKLPMRKFQCFVLIAR